MENASKALLMAAEVLIGVMIISIAVYLFNIYGNFSREKNDQIAADQLAQFNNQFLKYVGYRTNSDGITEQVILTIHDIASLANLARKNNETYGLITSDYNVQGTNNYIRIDLKIQGESEKHNLEQYTDRQMVDLIKNHALDFTQENLKKYVCLDTNYHISSHTGRVNYMKFTEI